MVTDITGILFKNTFYDHVWGKNMGNNITILTSTSFLHLFKPYKIFIHAILFVIISVPPFKNVKKYSCVMF